MKIIKKGLWYQLECPKGDLIWLGKVVNGMFTFRRNFKEGQVFHTKDVGSACLNKMLLEQLRNDGIIKTKYEYSNISVVGEKINRVYIISVDDWFACGVNYHNPIYPYDDQKQLTKGYFVKNEVSV